MEMFNQTINLFQVAEINLSYNLKFKNSERPTIQTSKDAYRILKQNWDEKKISCMILLGNKTGHSRGKLNVDKFILAG